MKIVIAGASGLVGTALVPALLGRGHDVRRLVRGRAAAGRDEIAWEPAAGTVDLAGLEQVDAIVNLAGENVAGGRWTEARRHRIRQSRVEATRTLVTAIAGMARKPMVLINASAIGIYGDRGDEPLTEEASLGAGFLAEVCRSWEKETEGATQCGVRTVLARFGMILAPEGGALAKMLPLFRLGLGGRMGDGSQWMSWISLDDVVGVLEHALREARCVGPLNVVAPAPVTNAEFARGLGHALHRPAVMPAPAWALRLAVGNGMANEALLASQRVVPQRLKAAAYPFRHATLAAALQAYCRPAA